MIFSVLIMALAAIFVTTDLNKIKEFISQAGAWGNCFEHFCFTPPWESRSSLRAVDAFHRALFGPVWGTLISW
jgi:uncharacterized membrane protein YdjX (TVP38/TMEM64 family)